MINSDDLKVETLGKADILSPLELSTTIGDGIVNFVEDNITIPYFIKNPHPEADRDLFC